MVKAALWPNCDCATHPMNTRYPETPSPAPPCSPHGGAFVLGSLAARCFGGNELVAERWLDAEQLRCLLDNLVGSPGPPPEILAPADTTWSVGALYLPLFRASILTTASFSRA